jgi:hypothetical protein
MQIEVLFYPARRFPQPWEVVQLSGIFICPMFGPFEQ